MISDDELRAMRARVDAAASGPWGVISGASLEVWSFIGSVRADVPRLLDEVARLRAELEVWSRPKQSCDCCGAAMTHALVCSSRCELAGGAGDDPKDDGT